MYRRFTRRRAPDHVDITGTWRGWSVYIPVDGFFFGDREAIYRIEATFKQRGRHLRMTERLSKIFDIDGNALDHIAGRDFTGNGIWTGRTEFTLSFDEYLSVSNGVMMGTTDPEASEITAMLLVRPRLGAPAVAVKLLLRPEDASDELELDDLNLRRIRRIVDD
jgi:hypothetical protein